MDMKKFVFLGLAVLGIALLAMVNVNLGDKSSNVSGVTLKNLEAITQENQEDWLSGECHTETSTSNLYSLTVSDGNSIFTYYNVDKITKECAPASGIYCEYGSKYYSHAYGYFITGSYTSQSCQG
jgi:hypothetical protein